MNTIPDNLCVNIRDEVISVPFEAFGWDFELSSFQVESAGKSYECFCLHRGDFSKWQRDGVPVRIHSGCLTSEVFGSPRCDCGWQLEHSLRYISQAERGMLIYLPWQEGCGNGLHQKIKSFRLMDDFGMTTSEAYTSLGLPPDNRDYRPALAILFRFNLLRIQLITNNPAKLDAVTRGGIEIVRRIPSIMQTTDPYLLKYLDSKAQQLGHLINGQDYEKLCRSTSISHS